MTPLHISSNAAGKTCNTTCQMYTGPARQKRAKNTNFAFTNHANGCKRIAAATQTRCPHFRNLTRSKTSKLSFEFSPKIPKEMPQTSPSLTRPCTDCCGRLRTVADGGSNAETMSGKHGPTPRPPNLPTIRRNNMDYSAQKPRSTATHFSRASLLFFSFLLLLLQCPRWSIFTSRVCKIL